MHTPLLIYLASLIGAVALMLMMPRPASASGSVVCGKMRPVGALIGAASLGGLWILLAWKTDLLTVIAEDQLGMPGSAYLYYYVFSAISIASAVRVITHHRPVYSALWFVMVVLSSAGLFLVLSADFMAFAMVIIYGGAILVTYMFVIMLASQPAGTDDDTAAPTYDRYARDPLWACVAGFALLAVLLTVHFDHNTLSANPQAAADSDTLVIESRLNNRAVTEQTQVLASSPTNRADQVSNVERVGLDLFESHPLAIELAGVILMMSLIGAIVIAKTRVEDEDAIARNQAPSNAPTTEDAPSA